MNGTVKAIIAGAVIFGVGLGFILLAVGLNGWDFPAKVDWEPKTYEYDGDIRDIYIDFSAGQLEIKKYDGDTIKVEYSHSERFTTDCKVLGTRLQISTSSVRWFNSFMWFNTIPKTTLYIPANQTVNMNVEVNAGQVTVSEGNYGDVFVELNAGTLDVYDMQCLDCEMVVNAGTLNVRSISCSKFSGNLSAGALNVSGLDCNNIKVTVSAGTANLTILGDKEDYTIVASVSAGRCNVHNQIGREDPVKHIKIDVSAGTANIRFDYPVTQ